MDLLSYATEQDRRALILKDKTLRTFGYDPDTLPSQSNKKVWIKCVVCQEPKQKPVYLYSLTAGRCISCSRKCGAILKRDRSLKKYGVTNPGQSQQAKERREETNQQRYGGKSCLASKKVRNKGLETIQKEYGVKNASHIPEARKKAQNTMEERYGAKHTLKSSLLRQRVEETNILRYGTPIAIQSKKVQQKRANTNFNRYGGVSPQCSEEVRRKTKQTNMKKYGVEYPIQTRHIKDKSLQTHLQRYGVEYIAQLPEYRNRLKEWCIHNSDKLYTTRGEREILEWVQNFYPDACKYKDGTHEIDIFIPNINLGIEYNGLYYHQESELIRRRAVDGKKYHLNKTTYFKKKGIRLIHIFEHEWRDRQEQVKSFLLSAIGRNQIKVGARKCKIEWSDKKKDKEKAHQFLEKYHIQGYVNNTIYVALVYYKEELVSVATFGKHHRNNKRSNKDWVLTRFCTKINYTIQGALSKISKVASHRLQSDVISWADCRLSQGNGYRKSNWIEEALLPPDYFYHRHGKVYSKQSRQKKIVGTPADITEREHAEMQGFERIYDCGKIRFRYKSTK